ncbi:MAG: cell wall-binding repeat-containing protein [Desulfitobacteriaceae bacterium]
MLWNTRSRVCKRNGFKAVPKQLLAVVLAAALLVQIFGAPRAAQAAGLVTRLEGSDRYRTALQVATTVKGSGNVVLTIGYNFPDALAAGTLAAKESAPILLLDQTVTASRASLEQTAKIAGPSGHVFLVGGQGVIGPAFRQALTGLGITANQIIQIGGADRYETASLVAGQEGLASGTPVFIASGDSYFDALAVSSVAASNGYPLLLVNHNELPNTVSSFLKQEQPTTVTIVASPGALSPSVVAAVQAAVTVSGNGTVRVIAGDSAYGTEALLLKQYAPHPDAVYLATGSDYADALTGSVPAAQNNVPVVLVDPTLNSTPPELASYFSASRSSTVTVIGGTGALPDSLVTNLTAQMGQSAIKLMPSPNQSVVSFPSAATLIAGSSYTISILPLDASGNPATLDGVPVLTWGTGSSTLALLATMSAPAAGSTNNSYTLTFSAPLIVQNTLLAAPLTLTVGGFSVSSAQNYTIVAPQSTSGGMETVPALLYPSEMATITKNFQWKFNNVTYNWTVQVPSDLLKEDQQTTAYVNRFFNSDASEQQALLQNATPAMQQLITSCESEQKGDFRPWVNDPSNAQFVSKMAQALAATAQADKDSSLQEANFFLSFVGGAIPYKITDLPQMAAETVVNNGDCKDTSILLAALLKTVGYKVALISFPAVPGTSVGHMTTGVAFEDMQRSQLAKLFYLSSSGVDYLNAETTTPGTYIGEAGNFSDQEASLENSGYVFPLQ